MEQVNRNVVTFQKGVTYIVNRHIFHMIQLEDSH